MIKTIDVAGIRLDNYTVREAIMNLEKKMGDNGFHTIEEVNIDMLMNAADDKVLREAIEESEFTVISEPGILEAVKASDYQRRNEIENHDFFHEIMKRIERNHKSLFIIGEEALRTAEIRARIEELYPRCEIAGAESLSECGGAPDNIVNLVNSLAPDVILSVLPHPLQEHFLMQYRGKLSAELWYGVGAIRLASDKKKLGDGIRRLIRLHKFEKQVKQYNDSNS